MCEHGDTVDLDVILVGKFSDSGNDEWAVRPVDRCIAPIVQALNNAHVWTRFSCCGHGVQRGRIDLYDGRKLYVHGD